MALCSGGLYIEFSLRQRGKRAWIHHPPAIWHDIHTVSAAAVLAYVCSEAVPILHVLIGVCTDRSNTIKGYLLMIYGCH